MRLLQTSAAALVAAACVAPASANLLTNPGFEDQDIVAPGGEEFFAGSGWTAFGGNTFLQDSSFGVVPNGGDQSLKMFGFSGMFQDFAINPGDTANGGIHMLNPGFDPLANGQVAAVNIEWKGAGGADLGFISNGTFIAGAPTDTWTLQTVTGVAPAGAEIARLTIITGDFLPGGPGGAPYYDDAFFEITPVPEPASLGLLALGGLAAARRRRA
ncbi:MAG: PEP-CTERM sorting domain-containing protein [Planctomycetota bacterium]